MKMGLLVFMRNLLLALCLFLVLGFLYYSAWKLHLLRWEDTKYDKLGFLLKLDSKLPPELASKYANFSEGVCKPGYASALMTSIFPKFSKPAPMFLDDSFKKWARIRDFVPPFGIKGQDNLIKAILSATKEYRLTPALDSLSCRRCIIVGNGGVLANKSLGLKIDDYDVVVRLNSAPVKGFEKDVGGKTTLRITYPEGAIQKLEQYEKDSFFVLAGFKWQDFKWLKYIVYKEKVSASDGFWKSVATRVPREPHEIRILNPYFIQEAAFSFIGLPFNNGLMGRGNIPTLGSVAITMALHNCDEVAVAGFGYDMNSPSAPLHYYESIKMSAIKEGSLHALACSARSSLEGDPGDRPQAVPTPRAFWGHEQPHDGLRAGGLRSQRSRFSLQVLDAQHPAREGVPAEAGESPSHHRPHQWNLSCPRRCVGGRRETHATAKGAGSGRATQESQLKGNTRNAQVLWERLPGSPVCTSAAPAASLMGLAGESWEWG